MLGLGIKHSMFSLMAGNNGIVEQRQVVKGVMALCGLQAAKPSTSGFAGQIEAQPEPLLGEACAPPSYCMCWGLLKTWLFDVGMVTNPDIQTYQASSR